MKNYYNEIDNALKEHENCKLWASKTISWICDRIDWCWRWKKITEEQMNELTDRVCNFLERGGMSTGGKTLF